MEKLLSIIIPTYNMEQYLPRCLSSLLVDSELLPLLDIIVVNDGSRDRSSEIAHEFADKYPGIYNVIDKQNGHYGSCINAGLGKAQGKYVRILDSDDYYATGEFDRMLRQIQGIEADAILTDFTEEYADAGDRFPKVYSYNDGYEVCLDTESCPDYEMHRVCYRTELLRINGYIQTEGIPYTDTEWVFYPRLFINKVVYIKADVYQYQLGREGQTMESSVFVRNIPSLWLILRNIIKHLAEKSDYLPHTKRVDLERFVSGRAKMIYHAELIQAEQADREILSGLEAALKMLNSNIYKSMTEEKPLGYFVALYRHGIIIPFGIRKAMNSVYASLLRTLRK